MGVKGSGELRFPDHENESTGQDITEEFGPDGSSNTNISLKSFYRGGSRVPNITENNSVPTTGEISLKDFYNAADLSFDGNLAGETGNFSFGTSTLIPAANSIFDMNSSGTANINHTWEMQQKETVANPPTDPPGFGPSSTSPAIAQGIVRIGNDQTNKRILILFLKDGTNSTPAGGLNGARASYRVLPYVGLENATWTAKIEYNTSSNGYDSTNGTIGTYNGSSNSTLSYSTSSTFHTVPTADTFESIPGFTGMAADGDSLTQDGSSRSYTWKASVGGSTFNYSSNTGSGTNSEGFLSTGCRITVKAVSGSDTFQTVSDYWEIGLSATKGGLL